LIKEMQPPRRETTRRAASSQEWRVCESFDQASVTAVHEAGHYFMARTCHADVSSVSAKASGHGKVELAAPAVVLPEHRIEVAEAGAAAERVFKGEDSQPAGSDDTLRYQAFQQMKRAGDSRDQVTIYATGRHEAERLLRDNPEIVLRLACVVHSRLNHSGGVPLNELETAMTNRGPARCDTED
jgi:hypothetical protein